MPAGATPPLPQAWSLLLVGPFLDKLVTADWVFSYTFTAGGWVRGGAVRGGAVRCGAVRCDAPICSALKCSRIPIGNVPANVHTDSCTLHCRRCRRAAAAAAAGAMFVLIASCSLAVLVNVSQFMCLGRFSAVSFQVGVGGGCRGGVGQALSGGVRMWGASGGAGGRAWWGPDSAWGPLLMRMRCTNASELCCASEGGRAGHGGHAAPGRLGGRAGAAGAR